MVDATGYPAPAAWGPADDRVVGVSHDDAQMYAAWRGLALPTEDEWEIAARTGAIELAGWEHVAGGILRGGFHELAQSTLDGSQSHPASARFSPTTLARAEERLSQYLGPVAKLVVRQAAAKARDESELYLLVADEIENPAEKKAFIRRAISSKV